MALGAPPQGILMMVGREILLLVMLGGAIGIPASLLAAHFSAGMISDLVFGTGITDLSGLGIAITLIVGTALIAGFFPARRALRIDQWTFALARYR
jgi:ABC-type antimicrobial peptide transport system permease subunit